MRAIKVVVVIAICGSCVQSDGLDGEIFFLTSRDGKS